MNDLSTHLTSNPSLSRSRAAWSSSLRRLSTAVCCASAWPSSLRVARSSACAACEAAAGGGRREGERGRRQRGALAVIGTLPDMCRHQGGSDRLQAASTYLHLKHRNRTQPGRWGATACVKNSCPWTNRNKGRRVTMAHLCFVLDARQIRLHLPPNILLLLVNLVLSLARGFGQLVLQISESSETFEIQIGRY